MFSSAGSSINLLPPQVSQWDPGCLPEPEQALHVTENWKLALQEDSKPVPLQFLH